MISYAQNFEDVILWRALKHLERGFYIDIGAQDPVKDSVSLCFYEAGWRGVHVEPSPHFAARIRAARPDEEVIGAVIGRSSGLIKFYESVKTGLSTCDPVLVERHTADGFEFREITAPCVTLSQILEGSGGQEIHWLKIDVEGFEAAVIASWSPSTVRPWIVVLESVKPDTHEPTFAEWEPALLGLGYAFVYFDGLNRFYLSEQHPELAHAFGAGPNLFDDFMLNGGNNCPFAAKLDHELASSREANHQLAEQRARELGALEQRLADVARQHEHATRALEQHHAEMAQALAEAQQQHETETRALGQELLAAGRASAEARQQHERQTRALEQQLAEAECACDAARHQFDVKVSELNTHTRQTVADLRREVASLRASASWRITAPVRWVHSKTVARSPARRKSPTPSRLRFWRRQLPAALTSSAGDPVGVPLSRSARIVCEQLRAARRK